MKRNRLILAAVVAAGLWWYTRRKAAPSKDYFANVRASFGL